MFEGVGRIVARNTVFQMAGRLVAACATLAITVFVASRFGSTGYGEFVKITTFVAFFYLLADFGLNAIYLKKQSAWEDLLVLRILMCCVLVLVLIAVLTVLPFGASQGYTAFARLGILLFAPSILFQAIITSTNAVFQKHLRYDIATAAIVIGSLVSVLFLLTAAAAGSSETGIILSVLSLLLGSAATALVGVSAVLAWFHKKHESPTFSRLWSLLVAGAPLGVTLLFNLVYFRIDSIILALTRSTQEVGIYGLAYKVFELPLVFPTFFMNAVYPIMLGVISDTSTSLSVNKREAISKTFLRIFFRSAIFLSLIAFCLSLVFWFAAPALSIIRSEFATSVSLFRILLLSLPIFFMTSLTMWSLIALGKQRALVFIYGTSMLMNIGLNVALVPTFGAVAAAWITVVSEAMVLDRKSVV